MISKERLREIFPEVMFENYGDIRCQHPENQRFTAGTRIMCGSCGQSKSIW